MKTTALNKFVASPRHVARSSDPRADLVGIVDLALGGLVLMSNPTEAFLFLGYLVGIA